MKKILAGVTFDDELYFLEIEQPTPEHPYFSMQGETVRPLKYSEAVEQSRERLEDGELWKMAVESGNTKLGLDEWIDFVLDTDGEISQIDNSLFPETIEANREDYIFESGSCGQHEEKDLKTYFIPKKDFHELMRIWKKYHLKKAKVKTPEIPEQDINRIIQLWLEKGAK